MARVEDLAGAGQVGKLAEHGQEVLAWTEEGCDLHEGGLAVARAGEAPVVGAGDARVDESAVFQGPHEDHREHPRDADLRDPGPSPGVEALAGLAGLLLGLPRGTQARLDARDLRALEEVLLEGLESRLEALRQRLVFLHCWLLRHL